jgi:uncharacterized protein YgbK (DUF1537 family)
MNSLNTIKPVKQSDLFKELRAEFQIDVLPLIRSKIEISGKKIVVLDDDPTGTQTVHGIPVLTEWSVEALIKEFENDLPAFYLLTNSRSLPLKAAQSINQEIGRNLILASNNTDRKFVTVSRSDSTLRGHFPGEVEALERALGDDFDGWLIIPFFEEGGRYTINNIHYVKEGEWLVPAGETPYARDTSFGYRSSNLTEWVQEKTGGRVSSDKVVSITLEDIRIGGPERVANILYTLQNSRVCIVNAVSRRDVEVFVLGLLLAEEQGKRFIYRTAASFVPVRAGITQRPLLSRNDLSLSQGGGALFIVGSYVPRTTKQVDKLLEKSQIQKIEINATKLLNKNDRRAELNGAAQQINRYLKEEKDLVIYTSRELITSYDGDRSLLVGQQISSGLVEIIKAISTRPRYILAKGGITSSDIATDGLNVRRALVLGQILPGVPVWQLGDESKFPNLTYIVFPGNVGEPDALVEILQVLCIDRNA